MLPLIARAFQTQAAKKYAKKEGVKKVGNVHQINSKDQTRGILNNSVPEYQLKSSKESAAKLKEEQSKIKEFLKNNDSKNANMQALLKDFESAEILLKLDNELKKEQNKIRLMSESAKGTSNFKNSEKDFYNNILYFQGVTPNTKEKIEIEKRNEKLQVNASRKTKERYGDNIVQFPRKMSTRAKSTQEALQEKNTETIQKEVQSLRKMTERRDKHFEEIQKKQLARKQKLEENRVISKLAEGIDYKPEQKQKKERKTMPSLLKMLGAGAQAQLQYFFKLHENPTIRKLFSQLMQGDMKGVFETIGGIKHIDKIFYSIMGFGVYKGVKKIWDLGQKTWKMAKGAWDLGTKAVNQVKSGFNALKSGQKAVKGGFTGTFTKEGRRQKRISKQTTALNNMREAKALKTAQTKYKGGLEQRIKNSKDSLRETKRFSSERSKLKKEIQNYEKELKIQNKDIKKSSNQVKRTTKKFKKQSTTLGSRAKESIQRNKARINAATTKLNAATTKSVASMKTSQTKAKARQSKAKARQGKVAQQFKRSGRKLGGGLINTIQKFARFIPGLGVAITAQSQAYSGYLGWSNQADIFGVPENKVTYQHKVSAQLGMIVEDVSFGLVGQNSVASKALIAQRFVLGDKIQDEDAIEDPEKVANQLNLEIQEMEQELDSLIGEERDELQRKIDEKKEKLNENSEEDEEDESLDETETKEIEAKKDTSLGLKQLTDLLGQSIQGKNAENTNIVNQISQGIQNHDTDKKREHNPLLMFEGSKSTVSNFLPSEG